MKPIISLISPSRNNLKYLKWSYNSVRKNAPANVEYCVASDYSEDGTVEWCEETAKKDSLFKYIVNDGTWFDENKDEPKRMGHTLLYDKLIGEVATSEVVMIWHADMYMAPNAIENVMKILKEKMVVSMTRIEPPLHPPGPEKITADFGTEPEQFKEDVFLSWLNTNGQDFNLQNLKGSQGMFAPWAIYKKDFLSIGGHDPLYAPQSREDSDLFNRFLLAEYKPVQLWNAFTYHMTCRGSRFNPKLTVPGQASNEWLAHNRKSERNFTRKWGHMVKVDKNMKPIVPHKYDVRFLVHKGNYQLLELLEPWCDRLFIDVSQDTIDEYIKAEQPNTMFNLKKRVFNMDQYYTEKESDISVEFIGSKLTTELFNSFIMNLAFILDQQVTRNIQDEIFDYDIFRVSVGRVKYYENDLIFCDKTKKKR